MKKLTAVLAVLAVLFLGLSVAQAKVSVSRTEDAIAALEGIRFDEESQAKLDVAIADFEALDTNIDLDQKVSNASALEDAKKEYVRLAIKTAVVLDQRRIADGHTKEEVAAAVTAARAAVDTYCAAPACEEIENYSSLLGLEKVYAARTDASASDDGGGDSASGDSGEEVELC